MLGLVPYHGLGLELGLRLFDSWFVVVNIGYVFLMRLGSRWGGKRIIDKVG